MASVSLSYKSPQGRVITPNPPAMRTMTSNADEPQKRSNTQKSQKLLQETKEGALTTSKRFREGKEKHHNTKKIQHRAREILQEKAFRAVIISNAIRPASETATKALYHQEQTQSARNQTPQLVHARSRTDEEEI